MSRSIDEFIKFLEGFHRYNCPEKYYRAWKILVLKTNEYRQNNSEFSDLNWAYEEFKKRVSGVTEQ